MNILIIFILLSLSFGYNNCQNNTDTILDSFYRNPFVLGKPDIQLPDSLGGQELNGFAVLVLTIDSSKTISSYKVAKFKACSKENKIKIDFSITSKKNVAKIKKYKNWFDNYVNKIKVTVNTNFNGRIQQKYNIGLMIRFNGSKIEHP